MGSLLRIFYAKPTDSHLYLPFSSSHSAHCKRAIPHGVALCVGRNCSTDEFLNKRCVEYKGYLKSQGYNADLVDNQFDRALSIERSELLKKNVKADKKVFPLVLDYNPILPDIQKFIQKHAHLLRSSPELLEIFPTKSVYMQVKVAVGSRDLLNLHINCLLLSSACESSFWLIQRHLVGEKHWSG